MHGLDYPAPWLYRPFTVLPGYLPLPSPLLINRFAGTVQYFFLNLYFNRRNNRVLYKTIYTSHAKV
jgi:hypothetical protein